MSRHSFDILFLVALGFIACQEPVATEACGDGYVDPSEQCDSSTGSATCQSLGYYNLQGTLTCTNQCVFDDSDCGGRCGDNVVDADQGEECDGGNLNGSSCQAQGSTGGVLACDVSCRFDVSGCTSFCGNGVLENDEVCDDRNDTMGDGCLHCQLEQGWNCAGQPSVCTPVCGDGLVRGDELCDREALDGNTCETRGFYQGTLACGGDCVSFDEEGCSGLCGDLVLDAEFGEVCDTVAPADLPSCGAVGYCGGILGCRSDCTGADYGACVGWTQVSAGGQHSCAVAQDGGLWCWGQNGYGQLGDGTTTPRNVPTRVSGMTGVAQVSAGKYHSCAVKTDQSAWCWGFNPYGQLGDNATHQTCFAADCSQAPVAVSGMGSGVVFIGAGRDHSCALKADGSAWCWGANGQRQLGDGTLINRPTPVLVSGLGAGVAQLSTGLRHNCVVKTDGSSRCWGQNFDGRLGDGTTNDSSIPVLVSGMDQQVAFISAGGHHTCLVKTNGSAWCWGANMAGQLGDGTTSQRLLPTAVSGLGSGVMQISAGGTEGSYETTCALKTDGSAWCWGENQYGQLGIGGTADATTPSQVAGMGSGVTAISAGGSTYMPDQVAHTCALRTDGTARCWGYNSYGNVGDGTTEHRYTPVAVSGQM